MQSAGQRHDSAADGASPAVRSGIRRLTPRATSPPTHPCADHPPGGGPWVGGLSRTIAAPTDAGAPRLTRPARRITGTGRKR